MTAKRNTVKLETEPVYFTIIGISSHENDYRLLWSINEKLNFSFSRGDNLVAGDGNEFSRFFHSDSDQQLVLVSNRCDDGFLLEKYKGLDFVLKFDTVLKNDDINTWIRNLRKSPLVSAAFHIPADDKTIQLLR